MSFGARLLEAMRKHGPLCVGIDPHPYLLGQWGLTDDPAGLRAFTETAVEAFAGRVAAVKPQSAFFERYGSAGIAVLESAVRDLRASGTVVVLDVKRGDIGSTARAYAEAYLDPRSPLASDAVTASPFLGLGSLQPMFDVALAHGAGVFVLAQTSNPEGAQVQQAVTSTGRTVAGEILAGLAERNDGASPLGSLGAVVGATLGGTAEQLQVNGPLLVPGVGAQGGSAESVRRLFADVLPHVLPSSSREILAAGPTVAGLRSAARATADDFARLLGA